MEVTIAIRDEDVMALLLAGNGEDPVVMAYARVVADAVAEKLSLDEASMATLRVSYTAAQEAMGQLKGVVERSLERYNSIAVPKEEMVKGEGDGV